MNKFLLLLVLTSPAYAGEPECLRDILNAESRGEPIEGVVAVGQSAIKKANNENTSVCDLKGVQRKHPVKEMAEYYLTLARHIINNPSTSVSKGADHWEVGTRPHLPGKVTRIIDNHVFYTLQPTREKR